ncbi:hypothetical protein [Helicobacter sp. MIT 11-5569]|nr:hypothetical protein [Helicobacter sp. MIT 11-5569]
MEFLSTYLNTIQDITINDKEHTHRTALENLANGQQKRRVSKR